MLLGLELWPLFTGALHLLAFLYQCLLHACSNTYTVELAVMFFKRLYEESVTPVRT